MSDTYSSYFGGDSTGLALPGVASPSDAVGAPASSSGGISGSTALGVGALGLGAAGFGAMLAKGESPLPQDYQQLRASVPGLQAEGDWLRGEAHQLAGQGGNTLDMASRGELTGPQQAQLGQYQTGLTNQARQQFFNMGRNPDQDTAFISQTADIDAKVNAMAQQQIQSSIALGLGQLSSGASFSGQGLGYSTAANNALIEAGKAQMAHDQAYSKSLTSAFGAIAGLVGTVGGAMIGGPAGAAVGGAAGSALGKAMQ